MDDYEIRFTVDEREVSQEEIRAEERRRYDAAFDLLVGDGVDFRDGGKAYTLDELHSLSLPEATDLLARTKESLGRERILQAMAGDLEKGEALWRGIAEKSPARENLQAQYVEMEADGILATCLQHEVDHLNGVLFIDYLSKLKRDRVMKKFAKQAKLRSEEA